jgi:hypothetical protein
MLLLNYCGRHLVDETHATVATAEPGHKHYDAHDAVAGLTLLKRGNVND